MFSPDGKLLVGQIRAVKGGRHWLKFWNAAHLEEIGSIEGIQNDFFGEMIFSPDGGTLAIGNQQAPQSKLYLIDVARRRLTSAIALGEKGLIRKPAFSPDGRQIAAIYQQILRPFPEPRAEESPQARAHLIDAATGGERERMVLPQGFPSSACFSPDGKTLATTGQGEVLLWDMTQP